MHGYIQTVHYTFNVISSDGRAGLRPKSIHHEEELCVASDIPRKKRKVVAESISVYTTRSQVEGQQENIVFLEGHPLQEISRSLGWIGTLSAQTITGRANADAHPSRHQDSLPISFCKTDS